MKRTTIPSNMIRVYLCIAICMIQGTSTINLFPRFDGWYNNLAHPNWGTPGNSMTRIVPAKYADGKSKPYSTKSGFPNSRVVSDIFTTENQNAPATSGQSVFLTFFVQHVVDDIVDTRRVSCPAEYMNIKVPNSSSVDESIMPVYRAKFASRTGKSTNSPRIMINEVTAWLDGSAIYGSSQSWSEHLREYQKGRLSSQHNSSEFGFPPFNFNGIPMLNPTLNTSAHLSKRNPGELLSFGNPRGNENVFLMATGIIWFRYHNFLAQKFSTENPEWSDEKIFENSRRWTVAIYQNIVLYEMLPALLNNIEIPTYTGYNSLVDPGISVEFSSAAMRIGHSMVPAGVVLRKSNCSMVVPLPDEYGMSAGEPALRLCNTYWQLQDAVTKHGVEDIVRGMAWQTTERPDEVISDDLRNFLYGPTKRSRMDLLALTIERGRDAGVASYNSARKMFGLSTVKDFSEFTDVSPEIIAKLRDAYYNDTNRLELYIGGLLEATADDANSPGPLFSRIILEQFIRLRDSDRFWFENRDNGIFSERELREIRNTTAYDVILSVTSIEENEIQRNVFLTEGSPCPSILVNSANFSTPCTPNKGRNLFEGYWVKYAGAAIFLLLSPVLSYFVMCGLAWYNQKPPAKKSTVTQLFGFIPTNLFYGKNQGVDDQRISQKIFRGVEILGRNNYRKVFLELEGKTMKVTKLPRKSLRTIHISRFNKALLLLSRDKGKTLMAIRVPKEYDIVLRFSDMDERNSTRSNVEKFLKQNGLDVQTIELKEKEFLEEAVTKEVRQYLLEAFFRNVFGEMLGINPEYTRLESVNISRNNNDVIDCELTEVELAEAMGMSSDSMFVQQMFRMADTDHSGYLSMREFADLVIILMNGSPEQKAKMLFDMYDVDKSGEISREEGKSMIRSFLGMSSQINKGVDIDEAVETIFRESGAEGGQGLTLEMFTHGLLKDHRDAFVSAQLILPGVKTSSKRSKATKEKRSSNDPQGSNPRKASLIKRISRKSMQFLRPSVNSDATVEKEEKQAWRRWMKTAKRYIENYRRHIFCLVIFYTITAVLMVERATHYALKTEHLGIRQVTEWGLITSRATAAAVSFHFTIILLTMCRNLITFGRETFLNNYIPFDAAVGFHKQIAYVAIVETIFHILGHLVNFYHLSVHPLPVLACLFPKILVDDGSDIPKPFVWWLFHTITGVTGILLVIVLSVIYIFAMRYSRRYCFRIFWMTHHLFIVLFILAILHGSVGLIQSPLFHFYLVGPAIIYAIDQLITISRSKMQISVVNANPLPSGVLNLIFKRPTGFDYKSGQWVRIACSSLGTSEYHPFTLTSAPHEEYLSLHIRAVGPWTTNMRNLCQNAIDEKIEFPKVLLAGPFGEGHQDWYKYEVCVLVGAGIGVTPFASILKDIVHKHSSNRGLRIACKKVYFIWVTRTQRHFEWLTDIIKNLEESDGDQMVDIHIYITQFQHKYDLRTTLLYICEKYFQKVASRSLFTGLQAETHFGRPQFESFFDSLGKLHNEVRNFGVFSCGPPGLTNGVESSCKAINKRGKSHFVHFFENF